jgi:Raf kinase inhibitor-like YbhB/YbcL family protein
VLRLTSSAFAPGQPIPAEHTCEGANSSPPLAWSGAPEGTKTFALIVDDPDAPDPKKPKMTFVHWVLYNLPADCHGLPAATQPPEGSAVGVNDRRQKAYTGPCPPIGRHRYFHKLYALDARLPELADASKGQVERLMEGHILEKAELMGTYQKGG